MSIDWKKVAKTAGSVAEETLEVAGTAGGAMVDGVAAAQPDAGTRAMAAFVHGSGKIVKEAKNIIDDIYER